MPSHMRRTLRPALASLLLALLLAGCAAPTQRHTSASVVDFLYPNVADPVVSPSVPTLTLPLRVGIAFVPGPESPGAPRRTDALQRLLAPGVWYGPSGLTEQRRIELMQKVADHFKQYPYVKSIELIPSAYLRPQGSFANLDQIRTMYGVDVMALVSYDQVQFNDSGALSFTYWTIVGAYVVPGEKNDTQTMMDTVVVDIPSRKMLFRAPGTDHVTGRATLVNATEQLRIDSAASFDKAAAQMVTSLDQQLALFKDRVKDNPAEYRVVRTAEYQQRAGGGSIDPLWLAAAGIAALAARRGRGR